MNYCPPHRWQFENKQLYCIDCLHEYKLKPHHWDILKALSIGIRYTTDIAKYINETYIKTHRWLSQLCGYGIIKRTLVDGNTFMWYIDG